MGFNASAVIKEIINLELNLCFSFKEEVLSTLLSS